MLLIDALYINVGGGKILLDYLITELEKTNVSIHYLIDQRIKGKHPKIKESNKLSYVTAGMKSRKHFYKKNGDTFTKALCFANIPAPIRGGFTCYTYFQNLILLDIPKEFSFLNRLKFQLKIAYIKSLKSNTDFWWVQTENVQKNLATKYKESINKIQLKPFYPAFSQSNSDEIERVSSSFLFVSNATPNKNHQRLLEGFCEFYDQHKTGKLVVTVNDQYPAVQELITQKIKRGYPIENVGFIKRNDLIDLYKKAEYLIYPSVNESFGLGLVEAIENGCKVIGADLPYTHDVCIPAFVFDPFDVNSIKNAFKRGVSEQFPASTSLINNQIKEIIAELIS